MAQSQALVAECPTCKAIVPIQATECPQCGELFEQEAPARQLVAARPDAAESDEEGPEERTSRREKLLFYTGIVLIILGGPVIALGSWLHDVLRIGVGQFTNFDVFGPYNRLASAVGLIVLIVGIVFLILSLRSSRPSDVEKDLSSVRES